jgi:hypothetical protein
LCRQYLQSVSYRHYDGSRTRLLQRIREQWERFIDGQEKRDILRKIHIRCYSAGQTNLPYTKDDAVADDFRQPAPRARRIEMHLTRLLDQEIEQSHSD